MAVMSDGKSYGVPPGVMFSFPGINFKCLRLYSE